MNTVGELLKYLKENQMPSDTPIGLLDLSTDNEDDMNYPANPEILDCWVDESRQQTRKGLFFIFENKLNDDPI